MIRPQQKLSYSKQEVNSLHWLGNILLYGINKKEFSEISIQTRPWIPVSTPCLSIQLLLLLLPKLLFICWLIYFLLHAVFIIYWLERPLTIWFIFLADCFVEENNFSPLIVKFWRRILIGLI